MAAIDFAGSKSDYLIHLAETDEFVSDDEAAFIEVTMGLEGPIRGCPALSGDQERFRRPDEENFNPEAFDQA